MRPLPLLKLAPLFVLAVLGCGGAGNVGESCERPGSVEDCVGGAICAPNEAPEGSSSDPVWDSYTCRDICDTQSDCEAGLECRGVSGSPTGERACQPPRSTTP